MTLILVSLENVVTDVHELEKGMDSVKKEVEMRMSNKNLNNMILKDFLANSESKLKRLRQEVKIAQDSFRECVEYFGESPRSCDANTFFSLLLRFMRAFRVRLYSILYNKRYINKIILHTDC